VNAEMHSLVGAYALDALDEREKAAFEQHLETCATCSAEVVEFQATAARLGAAVSAQPPAHLRQSVLTAARRTSQLRPVVTRLSVARWRRSAPRLLAAALVLAVVAIGGVYVFGPDGDNDEDLIAEVMSAPDVVTRPRGDAPVHVYSSPSLGKAVVAVEGLPEIDDKHSYEVWAIDADGPHSLGAMPESAESGMHLVDDLGDAQAVAITVEQAGGSPSGQPTSDPLPHATVNLS